MTYVKDFITTKDYTKKIDGFILSLKIKQANLTGYYSTIIKKYKH